MNSMEISHINIDLVLIIGVEFIDIKVIGLFVYQTSLTSQRYIHLLREHLEDALNNLPLDTGLMDSTR